MRYSVSKEVLEDVLKHLASRPYAEVSALIARLSQDAKALKEESAPANPVVSEDQAAS